MNLIRTALFEPRPACVMIDLDNTMYAYEPCHRAGMDAVRGLAKEALGIAGRDFDRCFADARSEIKARLGDQAASHNRLLYVQRALERAGLATRPLEALQLAQAYWLSFIDTIVLFHNLVEFLDDLRLADVPAIIVTDLTVEIQMRKLVALGLDAHVDWMVTSEESGHDKPHPASFELALAKLGGVEGPVWMIGDSYECDIVGAKQAVGACTLQILHDGIARVPEGREEIDGTFREFADLRQLLAKTRLE